MKVDEKVIGRLNKLINEGQNLENTLYINRDILEDVVDISLSNEWGIKSLNALEDIFADKRFFFEKFNECYEFLIQYGEAKFARKALGILKAAKSDYENGYSFKIRTLINAEMFQDFLEQSEELLKKNHYQAAAVIAGCVLEDGLRKLCDKNNISFPKKPTIEPMNVELAKIGIYKQFNKDKVSSLGKLRNHAAHGEWNEFTEKDVEDMIQDVRRFMEDYFN